MRLGERRLHVRRSAAKRVVFEHARVELYERFYLVSTPRNMAIDHKLAQIKEPWDKHPTLQAALG